MTPEARERRRIRTPVLAVTTVAWAVILLADPVRLAYGAEQGPDPVANHSNLTHAGHSHHALVDTGSSHASGGNIGWVLIGWALMLTAMMAPLTIPALRYAYVRSLRSRRWRAVSLVTMGHVAVWTAGGLALLAAASALRSVTGSADLALLLGLLVAVGWQLSPLKQSCLNRHCAFPPISAFGRAADRDALRFGGTHSAWCLGSCWGLMLVSMLVPTWHVAVMLGVSAWMWVEPFERPERPSWRVRLPLRSFRIARVTIRALLTRRVEVQAGVSAGR
jgi:predicted metal-binding membrane protein